MDLSEATMKRFTGKLAQLDELKVHRQHLLAAQVCHAGPWGQLRDGIADYMVLERHGRIGLRKESVCACETCAVLV